MSNKIFITIILVIVGIGLLLFFGKGGSDTKASTDVGNKAPDFYITTIDDKNIDSNELRGKTVVITSSAAWCSTCVIEAQQFAPVFKKYQDKEVIFITIDIDPSDSIDFIKEFRQNTDTPWDYADASGASKLIRDYELNRFEITYVIDKDGTIQYKDGNITSTEKLDGILKEILSKS